MLFLRFLSDQTLKLFPFFHVWVICFVDSCKPDQTQTSVENVSLALLNFCFLWFVWLGINDFVFENIRRKWNSVCNVFTAYFLQIPSKLTVKFIRSSDNNNLQNKNRLFWKDFPTNISYSTPMQTSPRQNYGSYTQWKFIICHLLYVPQLLIMFHIH